MKSTLTRECGSNIKLQNYALYILSDNITTWQSNKKVNGTSTSMWWQYLCCRANEHDAHNFSTNWHQTYTDMNGVVIVIRKYVQT